MAASLRAYRCRSLAKLPVASIPFYRLAARPSAGSLILTRINFSLPRSWPSQPQPALFSDMTQFDRMLPNIARSGGVRVVGELSSLASIAA